MKHKDVSDNNGSNRLLRANAHIAYELLGQKNVGERNNELKFKYSANIIPQRTELRYKQMQI